MALTKLVSIAAILVFTTPVLADTFSIVNEPNGVERPNRGMNMEQVRERFGAAQSEMSPVGEPPITRWVYNDFTVYYEQQYVIHSVAHKHNGYIGAPATGSSSSPSSSSDDGPLFLH